MHRSMDEPTGAAGAPAARSHPAPARTWAPPLAEAGAQPPDPAVLGALLLRHGWQRRGGAPGRYGRWTPPGAADAAGGLLVPESAAFPDSAELMEEALAALAHSPAPSARDILVSLAVPGDEIRWRREIPESAAAAAGASGWTEAEELRSAARQILLAGALAARGRAGYHGARHRRKARAALDEVLLGPGADGRALTAYLPAASGRAIAVRLCHALHATREAVDYQRATGSMDAFDSAVAAGAGRELTEALITLVRGCEGARVD
ncbi:hypothetical protein ACFVDN_35115, partial [Streptomyces californicus]